MFSDVVSDFEKITKFAITEYFEKYRNFMRDDYAYLAAYYGGTIESVTPYTVSTFEDLRKKSKVLMQQFINFSYRLSNCGFWELQTYCQDLHDVLEKLTKLPKYFRTSKTVRGYMPYVQVASDIGGMKTVKDVADAIGTDTVSEMSLIITNDLQEMDWEIDQLSSVTAFINNKTDVVVDTILEQPIGRRIYGRDINRKITIRDNDLDVREYEDNVEQKCDILLTLEQGDVPEYPYFGRVGFTGKNASSYNYAQLLHDLKLIFLRNSLFNLITIDDVSFRDGDLTVTCSIATKYSYKTQKTITL